MMRFSKIGSATQHELTQYLLGNLREEDCERFDELSIADDEFIERLRATENDLVDAYVRGQLPDGAVLAFESHYLATGVRRQKVAMARALLSAGPRSSLSGAPEFSTERQNTHSAMDWLMMRLPRRRLGWAFTAAVVIMSLATAWLAIENHRLREQDRASMATNRALEEQMHQLRRQLQIAQTSQNSPAPADEYKGIRNIGQPAPLVSSLFLLPPTRGADNIPAASVSLTDRELRLQLALESDDFSEYQVNLIDLAANRRVWHSVPVKSVNVNHRRALSLLLPLDDLKDRRYAAEVSGIAAPNGRLEELGSYVFRIHRGAPGSDERR